MNVKHITKLQFAELLGMSYRTLLRRAIDIKVKLPSGLLSPEFQEFFREKLKEHELKKLSNSIKN